ncbi:hypothetical protein PA25_07820 [Pseudoalteromonas sp. A25]|uniref:general secretion pathway protein GspB n=1 Tax=Pseudoalteromonas sp. A25 TaxID=116092 RepID=UPI001260F0C7|nr:general secretion pathway protein GspB [Pseudoalteromonas sp. A25]BBN80797.1 hypothetical protein PA25_07820 [Pseudoalteromonas sp. A25]
MSYLVNALKQAQQSAHSEQDHLAYQHQKQLKLYRLATLGLASVVLIGGFTFAGFVTGNYLQASMTQPIKTKQQQTVQQTAELVKENDNAVVEQVNKTNLSTAKPQQQAAMQLSAVPVNTVAQQPQLSNNMMNGMQYQWMSVQVGFDANGQALYRQQLVPVANGQVMNVVQTQQQPMSQPFVQPQNSQQMPQEDLSQYRVLGKPLAKPAKDDKEQEDSALAGVSDELKEAFAQAVAQTETQPTHHVTASSRDSARATPIELLPNALQNSLPPLRYQAHIYATDADKRWIKLNNRELYEGDSIGALQLVEITPEQALFNYDGYEFSMKAMQDWLP